MLAASFTSVAIFASLLFATESRDRKFWIVTVTALFGCILATRAEQISCS